MFAAIAILQHCFKIPELNPGFCHLDGAVRFPPRTFVRIPGPQWDLLTKFLEEKARTSAAPPSSACTDVHPAGALEHCAVGALGIMTLHQRHHHHSII